MKFLTCFLSFGCLFQLAWGTPKCSVCFDRSLPTLSTNFARRSMTCEEYDLKLKQHGYGTEEGCARLQLTLVDTCGCPHPSYRMESEPGVVDENHRIATSTHPLLDQNVRECSSSNPCSRCTGDCDSDDQCEGTMVCYQKNGGGSVPGCHGYDPSKTDWCIPAFFVASKPSNTDSPTPNKPGATKPPTLLPTVKPSGEKPTFAPTTNIPTPVPITTPPTLAPTPFPSNKPKPESTKKPTKVPSAKPVSKPKPKPANDSKPETQKPTVLQTKPPTSSPIVQTKPPTLAPVQTNPPTPFPSTKPKPVNDSKPATKKPTKPQTKKPTSPQTKPPTSSPVSKPPTPAPVSKPPTPGPVSKPPTPAPVSKPPTPAPASKPPTTSPVQKPKPKPSNDSKPSSKPSTKPVVNPTSPPTAPTIIDVAVSLPDFSTLVSLLTEAKLVEPLSGPGPFTVFAPTNDAFAALPQEVVTRLTDPMWFLHLQDVLLYHVLSGSVLSSALTDGLVAEMLNEEDILVNLNPIRINNSSNFVLPDVTASNGVIHAVDAVLIPTSVSLNLVALGLLDPDFSELVTLVGLANLTSVLGGPGNFTLLAPTNAAFAKLPNETLAFLRDPANVDALVNILTYHVLPEILYFSEFQSTQYTTVQGSPVTISSINSGTFVNDARVIAVDGLANNGVAHAIDTVLTVPVIQTVSEPVSKSTTLGNMVQLVNPVRKCTVNSKCKMCEGDCNTDEQCEGSLICYIRERNDGIEEHSVPGCAGRDPLKTDWCTSAEYKQTSILEDLFERRSRNLRR